MSKMSPSKPIVVKFSDSGTFKVAPKTSPSAYLLDPVFIHFSFIVTLVFALLLRPALPGIETPAQLALIWSIVFVINLIWIGVGCWLSKQLVNLGIMGAIYTPVVILPMVFISQALFQGFAIYLDPVGMTGYFPSFEPLAKAFFALICFDIIHGRFVAPHHPLVLAEIEPEPPYKALIARTPNWASGEPLAAPAPSEAAQEPQDTEETDVPDSLSTDAIEIGGRKFDPLSIKLIRSEEHYLSIQFTHGTKLIRAKLSDAAEQLGLGVGYQVNRSVWVAYSEIRNLRKSNGRLELELNGGEVITVTRARQQAFLQAYDLQTENTMN